MASKRPAEEGPDGQQEAKRLAKRESFGGAGEEAVEKAKVAAKRLVESDPERLRPTPEQERGLVFLYAKGVDSLVREPLWEFACLVDPARAGNHLIFHRAYYERAMERLMRLSSTEEGDPHADSVPDDVESWDRFLQKAAPEWGSREASFVFFRDHEQVNREDQPNCLVQRVQLSGLCYLHGPDVLQHYLVAMATETPKVAVPMADLTKLIRRGFTAKELYDHIFNNEGGVSRAALDSFLLPGSVMFTEGAHRITKETLQEYGPGLVSNFQVRPEFQDAGRWSFLGVPEGDSIIGGHAMVLVGVRGEGPERRFLLQNWWKTKQFVEVDAEYLKRSKAEVHFVETPQPRFPEGEVTLSALYAETEQVDQRDRLACDGSE